MKKTLFTAILTLFIVVFSHAAVVETVETFSASMDKKINAVVITPASYTKGKDFPVIYLLHGFGDTYAGWSANVIGLNAMSDLYHVIFVCPDGSTSWYMDSPVKKDFKYETYVSSELVKWVDQKYKTIKNRSGRGITGLSMGGHGALYLAFRHQDVYGVAGSTSGGVDIRPFPNNWNLALDLGKYADQPENWEKNTVINLVNLLTPNSLSLIVDCGTEDFFYEVNLNLHKKLLQNNIPHDFIVRPGAHNWQYWKNSIKYQVLFMNDYFQKNK